MARPRAVLPLAFAAVVVLLAVAVAAAPSDPRPPKAQGPKEPEPPKAQGPKDSEPPKDQGPKDKPKPMKVKCEEKKLYPYCRKKMECPADCPQSCYVDCDICKPVCGKVSDGLPPEAQGPKDPSPPNTQDPKDPKPPKDQGPKDKPKPVKVKCEEKKKLYPYCRKPMECPANCPQSCFADCDLCKPVCLCNVPGACGDPRFIGGDGNSFYFHGRRDADFCVLSDRDIHINAHFIGKRGDGMSRDFTWIQAIAVLFDGGHKLYIGAKKTATWDDDVDRLEISLDGEHVHLPEGAAATWTSSAVPGLSVTRTKAANGVLVVLDGKLKIRANVVPITEEESRVHRYGVTADDCLAHLDLAFKFDTLTDDVHGVVGQTYRSDYVNRFDVKASMPTMGGESNFTTSSLFAADCAVARFAPGQHNVVGAAVMSELAGVTCASGMAGQRVVCKK